EARSYLWHAIDNVDNHAQKCCPYLQEPWDKNGNNNLEVAPNGEVITASGTTLNAGSFRSFQKLCANPDSFQIICAGLDGEFTDTSATTLKTVPNVQHNGQSYTLYY